MILDIIKIEKDGDRYVLFNKRGMVLELTQEEYHIFRAHANKKQFPRAHREFFNRLCCYEMTSFEGYIPRKVPTEYSQALLIHDSEEPAFRSPIVAHLGVTSACNMRCKYCSIRQPYAKAKELSTTEWKRIIDKLAHLGVFQIGLTGGEPTLRKDLIELAEYITSRRCAFNLTTNGWALDRDLIVRLKQAGMRQCQVSLDCHLPTINDRLRGDGACLRAIRAVRLLRDEGIAVGIDCVVSKNNLSHLEEFVAWLNAERIPYLTLIKIKQGDLPLADFKSMLPEYHSYCTLIEKLCNRTNEMPCVTLDCGSVSNLERVLRPQEAKAVPIAGCPVGHTLLSISPDGSVFPCVAMGAHRYCLGNAKDTDLRSMWNENILLRSLRKMKSKIEGQCKECERLDHCRGGCRGIAESLCGGLWKSDETCGYGTGRESNTQKR